MQASSSSKVPADRQAGARGRARRGRGRARRSPRVAATLAALGSRNYRLFFTGQAISLPGTWMQSVALSWLVLELTHSGTAIGLVVSAQFMPVLVLGAYGGLLADRAPKRTLLVGTQSAFALLALMMGLLVVTGAVRLWMVFAVAVLLGLVAAVDNPTRQAFVIEMVGERRVQNAVSLNSVLVNASRLIGPAIAGTLIATVGPGFCFLVNAASFAGVIVALRLMRAEELHPTAPLPREPGQLRAGLRYVRASKDLFVPLLMMALIGTLAYEFPVVLPLLASRTLGGGAEVFGFLTAAMGAGAVLGGLLIASTGLSGLAPLTVAAAAFGVTILLASLAPSLAVALPALVLVGACSTAFMATGNTTLQLASKERFRGRVMALWSVTFQGSTPIGAPIVGAVCENLSPRAGLQLGALACLLAAAAGASIVGSAPPRLRLGRLRRRIDWRRYQQAHGT